MGHRSNNAHEHRGSKYHKWSGIEHNKMKWSEIKIEKNKKQNRRNHLIHCLDIIVKEAKKANGIKCSLGNVFPWLLVPGNRKLCEWKCFKMKLTFYKLPISPTNNKKETKLQNSETGKNPTGFQLFLLHCVPMINYPTQGLTRNI